MADEEKVVGTFEADENTRNFIYNFIEEDILTLTLVNIGTHSDIF